MGMTLTEYSLFACGGICLAFFGLRSIVPYFRSRLDNTAETTSRILREEFLSLTSNQVRGILVVAGGVAGIVVMVSRMDIIWVLVVGFSPVLVCSGVVRTIRTKRRKRIVSQLPTFLEILSGHVKAGHSIPESLQEAVPLLSSGIREEIAWLCQVIRLGTPLTEALLAWEQRMECEEVSLIVCPLRIAIPAGGNLYDLLKRCRDILRAKMRQEEKMRSMTAQARLQALVLTLLPPGFITLLSIVDPEYLVRCRRTGAGMTILAVAGALQFFGWLSIRRIMAAKK
jgi:tight adherence protein B